MEFYRQVAQPYEDEKKRLNGAVSELDMNISEETAREAAAEKMMLTKRYYQTE